MFASMRLGCTRFGGSDRCSVDVQCSLGFTEEHGTYAGASRPVPHKDLIVMKKAPGKSLDFVISEKWRRALHAHDHM